MTVGVDIELVRVAEDLARSAAELTLQYFGAGSLAIERKADGSFVTAADRAAEDLLRSEISARYPDDTIIGEERGTRSGTSGRSWIIDPIDGTESFVRSVPLYATLLAAVDEHGPAVGVVIVPALGLGAVAGRGRGCSWDGQPLSVSATTDVSGACVSSSSFDQPWWPSNALHRLTASGVKTRTWGDGYGYVLVAGGQIDAMTDPGLNPWDIAPMLTIIPEAGGRISTWRGGTDLAGGAWLASNGHLHDPLIEVLSERPPPTTLRQ